MENVITHQMFIVSESENNLPSYVNLWKGILKFNKGSDYGRPEIAWPEAT